MVSAATIASAPTDTISTPPLPLPFAPKTFLLNENAPFRALVGKIKTLHLLPKVDQDIENLNFHVKKAARRKFKSSLRFNMNETLTEEIELLRSWLSPTSGINCELPIGHLFHCTLFTESVCDNSCKGGRGFSIKLCFWWHLLWPKKVYHDKSLDEEQQQGSAEHR